MLEKVQESLVPSEASEFHLMKWFGGLIIKKTKPIFDAKLEIDRICNN